MIGTFEAHGFRSSYDVEVQPEYPPDGRWSEPAHCFDREGRRSDEPGTRWGPPLVIRVVPHHGGPWIGFFETGGLGGISGLHACPHSTGLCVIAEGLAYVVDTEKPADGAKPLSHQVHQVVGLADRAILLLVTYTDAIAIGRDGVAWRTDRLAPDGLWAESVTDDWISFSADRSDGGTELVVVDTASGVVRSRRSSPR